mmetsp:Transcript_13628/g.21276  ORF Transcript_13628/g.21276 Transcript_13628/m.21276 type:complete len:316 (-) Transcript_13628:323-1270(-)
MKYRGQWPVLPRLPFVLTLGLGICLGFVVNFSHKNQSLLPGGPASAACSDSSYAIRLDGAWDAVEDVTRDTDLCPTGLKPNGKGCGYDALVVLGGGPQSKDGSLPVWTKRRCDAVLQIEKCCSRNSSDPTPIRIITTSAGSVHVPNTLDTEGFPVTEAKAAAHYLIRKGMDPKYVVEEGASWDTIGNAWFVRCFHTDIRNWRRLLIVTSEFHMPRSRAIFEWIMGIPRLSERHIKHHKPALDNTEQRCLVEQPYTLGFLAVSDKGIGMVQDRIKREMKSLENVWKLSKKYRNAEQVHQWLYTDHNAYSRLRPLPA